MTELIWSFDHSEGDEDYMIAAYQDFGVGIRGTNNSNTSQWLKRGSGDGFAAQLDYRKKNEGYIGLGGSNTLAKLDNDSHSILDLSNSSNPGFFPQLCPALNSSFIPCENPKGFKIVNHPITEELYYGRTEIHKIVGSSWKAVSDIRTTIPGFFISASNRKISQFVIAPSNPDYIYVVIQGAPEYNMPTRLFRSTTGFVVPNTLPAIPKFIDITNGDPNLASGSNVGIPKIASSPFTPNYPVIVTDIAVDPKNHLRVWLTVTGYQGGTNTNYRVIYSNDGGHSWVDWDPYGKIPFPVNSIVYQEGTNDRLVIGCDDGLYVKEGGQYENWNHITDFPYVRITELKINSCSGKLRAATFGRGLWEGVLPDGGVDRQQIVSSSTTWSGDVYKTQNIRVPNGVTLTITGTLYMPKKGKIIVETGGKLIVSGKITNACNAMWQGIEVAGNASLPQSYTQQGAVEINGGIIENAYNAIATKEVYSNGNYSTSTTGGIIEITDGQFINNKRDLEFLSYHNTNAGGSTESNNMSFIKRSSFERTDDYLADDVFSHITMWDVNGIEISGCTFEDNRTNTPNNQMTMGIFTTDAAYKLQKDITTNQSSEFRDLEFGVHSTGLNNSNQFSISIEDSKFECRHSIMLSAIDNAKVLNNRIQTPTDYSHNINNQVTDYTFPYGIYMNTCTNYLVDYNDLTSNNMGQGEGLSVGIVVRNMHPFTEYLFKNTIKSYVVGVEAIGQNKDDASSAGLQIKCNTFGNNSYDIFVTNDLINPQNGSHIGIATQQGSLQYPAGNIFSINSSYLVSNIENQGNTLIDYTHHDPNIDGLRPNIISSNVFLYSSTRDYQSGCLNKRRRSLPTVGHDVKSIVTSEDVYQKLASLHQSTDAAQLGSAKELLASLESKDLNSKAKEDYQDFVTFLTLKEQWKSKDIPLNNLSEEELQKLLPLSRKVSLVGSKAIALLELNQNKPSTKPVYLPKANSSNKTKDSHLNITGQEGTLKAYPNPAQQEFTLDYIVKDMTGDIHIRMVNIIGQPVYQHVSANHQGQLLINIDNMPSGVYFCQLIVNNTILCSEKVNIIK